MDTCESGRSIWTMTNRMRDRPSFGSRSTRMTASRPLHKMWQPSPLQGTANPWSPEVGMARPDCGTATCRTTPIRHAKWCSEAIRFPSRPLLFGNPTIPASRAAKARPKILNAEGAHVKPSQSGGTTKPSGGQQAPDKAPANPSQIMVMTGSFDYSARIWNGADGSLTANLKGHCGPVSALAFAGTNGEEVLTGSHDETARLWTLNKDDNTSGGFRIRLLRHSGAVTSLAALSAARTGAALSVQRQPPVNQGAPIPTGEVSHRAPTDHKESAGKPSSPAPAGQQPPRRWQRCARPGAGPRAWPGCSRLATSRSEPRLPRRPAPLGKRRPIKQPRCPPFPRQC